MARMQHAQSRSNPSWIVVRAVRHQKGNTGRASSGLSYIHTYIHIYYYSVPQYVHSRQLRGKWLQSQTQTRSFLTRRGCRYRLQTVPVLEHDVCLYHSLRYAYVYIYIYIYICMHVSIICVCIYGYVYTYIYSYYVGIGGV